MGNQTEQDFERCGRLERGHPNDGQLQSEDLRLGSRFREPLDLCWIGQLDDHVKLGLRCARKIDNADTAHFQFAGNRQWRTSHNPVATALQQYLVICDQRCPKDAAAQIITLTKTA